MASATFTGNIVDENDTAVDCKYQAWHKEQNAWSGVRDHELNQFSIDLADTDWLTNSNTATNSGETVLIAFWSGNGSGGATGADRSGAKDRFGVVAITLDGSNVYNFDAQIIPREEADPAWTLPNTGTINHELDGNLNNNDENADTHSWSYGGASQAMADQNFKHDRNFHGVLVFNSVGNLTHTYDYKDGNGFVSSDKVTYAAIGDYDAVHKVVNDDYPTLEAEEIESVRIFYNEPTMVYTESPVNPKLGDTVNIRAVITDVDSRITNIKYYFDGSLIKEGTNLDDNYDSPALTTNKTYNYVTEVYWNDGFNDQQVDFSGAVPLENQAPTVALVVNEGAGNVYSFVSNAADLENRLDKVQFKLYIESNGVITEEPETESWSLLDSTDVMASPWNSSITFYAGGKFKITCQAFDTDGDGSNDLSSIIDEEVFMISGGSGGDQTTFFDSFE